MRLISKLIYFSPSIAYFVVVGIQTAILYWMSARMEIIFLILLGILMGGATMLLIIAIDASERTRRLQEVVDRIQEECPGAKVYASQERMIYPRSQAEFHKDFEAMWDDSEDETDEPPVKFPIR